MKKIVIVLGLLFISVSATAAEIEAFSIEGKYRAAFPEAPNFSAGMGTGNSLHRSYEYTDEENLVIYTATFQVGTVEFKERDLPKALADHVSGQALSVNGKVGSIDIKIVNENLSAVFSITYAYKGVTIRKFGIVSYNGGHFYQWAVQDFPSLSHLSAEEIFNKHINLFSIVD